MNEPDAVMMELSNQDRELLGALRSADNPTPSDAQRIRGAVLARVGAPVALGAASLLGAKTAVPASAAGAKSGLALWATKLGVAKLAAAKSLAVLGTGAVLSTGAVVTWQSSQGSVGTNAPASGEALHQNQASTFAYNQGTPQVAEPRMEEPLATATSSAELQAVSPQELDRDNLPNARPKTQRATQTKSRAKSAATVTADRTTRANTAAAIVKDTLSVEVELVRAAHQALSAGNASLALKRVAEHSRRFPQGVLAAERQSIRAIAWCQTGKLAKGRVIAARLLRGNSRSPVAGRLRSACQLPVKPTE